ncbi:DUF3369 domain-containing protein [Colwelliaceae bacterium 6441]
MDWLAEESSIDNTSNDDAKEWPWKVVIVDDDQEIHKVTKMTLSNFEFEGRKLEFINLYSGEEAKNYFSKHDDISLVFLDVVMESNHAGLNVVKHIRETLNNHYTRIVLRTGQPGNAPENDVIRDYDIDGYKSKTELTVSSLNHAVFIALRSYRDLIRIQNYQKGLEALIHSIVHLKEIEDVMELSSAILTQIKYVLNAENTHLIIKEPQAYAFTHSKTKAWNIAMDDTQAVFVDKKRLEAKDSPLVKIVHQAFSEKSSVISPPYFCHYYCSHKGTETVFTLKHQEKLNRMSLKLINLFSNNIALIIENLLLTQEKA